MRITRQQLIAGVPATRLRQAFRAIGSLSGTVSAAFLGAELGLSAEDGAPVIASLLDEGYLCVGPPGTALHLDRANEEAYNKRLGGEALTFELTTKGNALSGARLRTYKRTSAEAALANCLEAVRHINSDPQGVFMVKTLVLFGSLLDQQRDRVGDVDLAVDLDPLRPDDDWPARWRARIGAAEDAGRCFRSTVDRVSWPIQEVWRHLRGRSGIISLVEYSAHRPLLATVPHKVLVENGVLTKPTIH